VVVIIAPAVLLDFTVLTAVVTLRRVPEIALLIPSCHSIPAEVVRVRVKIPMHINIYIP